MQRLKTRAQFQAVLGGEVIAKTSHFALHRLKLEANSPITSLAMFSVCPSVNDSWFGAMVPKRWAKRAVTRNAIKRQIYAVTASLNFSLLPAVNLVRLRREFSRKDYTSASSIVLKEAVRTELMVLIQSAATLDQSGPAVV